MLFTKEKMAKTKNKIHVWSQPNTVTDAVHCLKQGQVLLTSTDTIVGLLAPLTDTGHALLDSIKERRDKPYLILTESFDRLASYIEPISNLHIEKLISRCWPGPVTILFKAWPTAPAWMRSAGDTIGIRIPRHTGLLQVLAQTEGLFSTSANITGHTVPATIAEVDETIITQVAYVIDDLDDGTARADVVASTILDCSQGDIRVVRHGAYPIEELSLMAEVKIS